MTRVAELSFEEKNFVDRWSRVREDFWGDLKIQTLRTVKRMLETSMELEVQDLIGTPRWKHSLNRRNYRNGHYCRDLLVGLGWISNLRVPRVRGGGIKFKLLPRYERRSHDVNEQVLEIFLAGVSTRRVREVLKPMLGEPTLSAATVSEITKILDSDVSEYHRRPISDEYVYLIADGVYLKTKSPVHIRRRCVLVVYGIKADGTQELIDFRLARKGESQAAWEGLLTSLRNRGLEGKKLLLAVLDGNKGLWNALDMVWPDVARQRCWAHKLRNVTQKVPKKLQHTCAVQARDIYDAPGYRQAINAYRKWERFWKPIAPEAVACLEEDLEDMLRFFECPKAMWVKLRTTNIIERTFREVRRRTTPMSCFANTQSVDRIIYAIFTRQNNLWREKPLKEITQKS